jgi:hypothetical protein
MEPAAQILGDFDRLERVIAQEGFRGCPFVNAVAELVGMADASKPRKAGGTPRRHPVNEVALAFKEQRRGFFRELLGRLNVPDPEGLSFQLAVLVDGAIAQALVRGDPAMARASKATAATLLRAAGVPVVEQIAVPRPRQICARDLRPVVSAAAPVPPKPSKPGARRTRRSTSM